jgi:hypothetical protein
VSRQLPHSDAYAEFDNDLDDLNENQRESCFAIASWAQAKCVASRAIVEREREEARKDAERLNWLNGRVSWFIATHAFNPDYPNVREAIDAARALTPTETTT